MTYKPNISTDAKESVRVATTADITLSGLQTIDGVSVEAGDRVLVKNQNQGAQNGVYVVAAGASWSRAKDADQNSEMKSGTFFFVSEGAVNGDKFWVLTTNNPIVLGETELGFSVVGSGDLSGPEESEDNSVARFDGVSGDVLDGSSLYITDAGMVGIGTSSPAALLDVYGTIGTSSSVAFQALDTSTGFLVIKNGTETPDEFVAELHARSVGTSNSGLVLRGEPSVDSASVSSVVIDGYFNGGSLSDASILNISNNGDEVLRVSASGHVGIGTGDPISTLHVNGTFQIGVPSVYRIFQGTTTTSDDSATNIQTIETASDTSYLLEVRVIGRRTSGSGDAGDTGTYIRCVTVKNIGGTVSFGTPTDIHTDVDGAWGAVSFFASSNNLNVRVTGASGVNISWASTAFLQLI